MREETRKKLDEISRQSSWCVFLLAGLFALVLWHYSIAGRVVVSERAAKGEVKWAVWKVRSTTGQWYPDIQVILPDGRPVRVDTLAPVLPEPGSIIVLRERSMFTGYTSHTWDGPKP